MGAVVPSEDLPEHLQNNIVPTSDLPDELAPPKADPDVTQFFKFQGRNPTQDELASIKAVNAGNMFGAIGNAFIGKPLQSAVAGWRGIWDTISGKGAQQAARDVEETNTSPEMTGTGAVAANAVLGSRLNPMNWADIAGQKLGDATMEATNSPGLATAARVAPDAIAALMGFRKGVSEGEPSPMVQPEAAEGNTAFRGIAEAERQRLADIHSRGSAAGLDLPESGTQDRFAAASAHNTQAANSIVRRHFGLPDDPEGAAPLTPEMMDAVAGQVARQTYGPVRAQPTVSISAAATDAIDALPPVIRNKLKLQGRPLTDATPEQVTGGEFVDLSQRLRAVARSYDTAYARGGHPEAGSLADLAHDAVDAWEQSGENSMRASGRGDIADAWRAGRTTIAQTHDVAAALDGAGNVNVAALRKRPYLTGDLDMLANLGGRYPDAFRVTRISQPQPGLARRAAAGTARMLAPVGGAAAGGFIAGPLGAAGGAGAGRVMGERIAESLTSK